MCCNTSNLKCTPIWRALWRGQIEVLLLRFMLWHFGYTHSYFLELHYFIDQFVLESFVVARKVSHFLPFSVGVCALSVFRFSRWVARHLWVISGFCTYDQNFVILYYYGGKWRPLSNKNGSSHLNLPCRESSVYALASHLPKSHITKCFLSLFPWTIDLPPTMAK